MMVKKDCFGILDKVFPLGEKGFREVVPACFDCSDRIPCLKAALTTKEGLKMKAETLERAEAGGLIGRFQRWSKKKELSRLMKQIQEKKR